MTPASQSPDLPKDDSPVDDDVLVYRLVPVWSCDSVDGQWEFQSAAFDNATPEHDDYSRDDMSVVLGDTLAALSRSPEALPSDTPWAGDKWGVAVLKSGYLQRSEEQDIRRSPNKVEPAHGDVRGKKNRSRRRRLKAHAQWLVPPLEPPP